MRTVVSSKKCPVRIGCIVEVRTERPGEQGAWLSGPDLWRPAGSLG